MILKIVLVSVILFSSIFLTIIFSVPSLIDSNLNLFDATSSGGKASAQGVSSSEGASSGSKSSSSPIEKGGGGIGSSGQFGSILTNPTDIIISAPSINYRPEIDGGSLNLSWNNTDVIRLEKIELIDPNNVIKFSEPSISIPVHDSGISNAFIKYDIEKPVGYGVHQIPLKITIIDGITKYAAVSIITIDNSGIFVITDYIRSLFFDSTQRFILV